MDEKKFREKLNVILKKPRYSHFSTGAVPHLINDVVQAAKECKISEELPETTEEEAVEE